MNDERAARRAGTSGAASGNERRGERERAARRAGTSGAASGNERRGERVMCDVVWCLAEGDASTGLCAVHRGAKRLERVMVGDRCVRCRRALQVGDWLTRDSTVTEPQHVMCPPKARSSKDYAAREAWPRLA